MGTNYFTFQSAATAAGNGEVLRVGDNVFAQVEVTISASATVTFEGTGYDATDWRAVLCQNMTTGAVATTATASGLYLFPLQGLLRARVRISTFGSGTITAKAVVSPYPFVVLPHGVTAAAAALADNTANPTTTLTGALAHGFDGTTWDRLRTAAALLSSGGGEGLGVGAFGYDDTNNLWRPVRTADADGKVASQQHLHMMSAYNGATVDRWRGNVADTLLTSAARTVQTATATQLNYNGRGVVLYLNVTAASGTGGLAVTIRTYDQISGQQIVLTAVPWPITATGIYGYELGPGSTTAPTGGPYYLQQRTAGQLPRYWWVLVDHLDGSSYTYSLSYQLIV